MLVYHTVYDQLKLTKIIAINRCSTSGTMNTPSYSSIEEKNSKEMIGKVYGSTELCLVYRRDTPY